MSHAQATHEGSRSGRCIEFPSPTGAGPLRGRRPGLTASRYDRSVLLRCTKKLLAVLGSGLVVESAVVPDPLDWYANLVFFDGRKCLLLTHAGTLFTVLEPDIRAHDLRPPQAFVVGVVERELAAENLSTDTFGRLNDEGLRIARTADRSVLGCMNDMAYLAGDLIARAGGLKHASIGSVNRALRRNINSSRGYARPIDLVLECVSRPPQ